LQLASHEGTVIGGGKKFLSRYDLGKFTTQRYKKMDKEFISAVELVKGAAVTGHFNGGIQLLDLGSGERVTSMKVVSRVRSRTWTWWPGSGECPSRSTSS
jgi:hypothetical protein